MKEEGKFTGKEYDKAMEDMECWSTIEHMKKCYKCQQEWIKEQKIQAEIDEAQYNADCAYGQSKAEAMEQEGF